MKIVADENIPNIKQYFCSSDALLLKPGRAITNADLRDADLLLVRSVTRVNQSLLENTAVKFVGSVTTGIDHLDTAWLDKKNIAWYAAQGFNARAVVEYVICVIAALQKDSLLAQENLRAAVVGVGRIGAEVAKLLRVLGFEVVLCDPVRAAQDKNFQSVPLEVLVDFDLITVHTPLTRTGSYPTYHMINKTILQKQKKGCVLLNTSRGAVIDFSDLALYGEALYWCLDVWEHEPSIESDILALATIATPHIAGYSKQSKLRGVEDVYRAACRLGVMPVSNDAPAVYYPSDAVSLPNCAVDWRDIVLRIYDPRETTQQMQRTLVVEDSSVMFEKLRKQFNSRHEFQYVTVANTQLQERDALLLKMLGISTISA